MKIESITVTRIYKAPLPRNKEASFCYDLELQRNCFSMKLRDWDRFINNTIDVCDWPVPQWTIDQVRECVRIFEQEYMSCCCSTSGIVHDNHLVGMVVSYADREIDVSSNDIVATLWNIISDPENEWVIDNRTLMFMIRDSIHDIGYVEDPFPFVGTTNEFGEPCESPIQFYQTYLPTLMALAKLFLDVKRPS